MTAECRKKKKKERINHEQSEEGKDESRAKRQKVDKKANRDMVVGGGKAGTEKKTSESVGKRGKKGSRVSESVEQQPPEKSGREEVERQLLYLSATPHTKLMVSPDAEQLWFDQVCLLSLHSNDIIQSKCGHFLAFKGIDPL